MYVGLKDSGVGLRVLIQRAPESKTCKSRIHLDIEADDVETEVRRLEDLGARRQEQVEDCWVMLDPCGDEFCAAPAGSDQFEACTRTWQGGEGSAWYGRL